MRIAVGATLSILSGYPDVRYREALHFQFNLNDNGDKLISRPAWQLRVGVDRRGLLCLFSCNRYF